MLALLARAPRCFASRPLRIGIPSWLSARHRSDFVSGHRREILEAFVRENTEISNSFSLTPEVSMHLITPSCAFYQATESDLSVLKERHRIEAPFWGFWWPGGQSLARFVLDNQAVVHGKRVLDLGAGCGGVGIACKLAGAAHVCANDIDDCALVACQLNQSLNGVALDGFEPRSLIGRATDADDARPWDVILAGDICYDQEFATLALDWLRRQVAMGTEVLIGDPGRAYLPLAGRCLELVHTYRLPDSVEEQNHGMVNGGVYRVMVPQREAVK